MDIKIRNYGEIEQIEEFASQIPNQKMLDMVLGRVTNDIKRREMFRFMKKYLTFKNPKCPEALYGKTNDKETKEPAIQ